MWNNIIKWIARIVVAIDCLGISALITAQFIYKNINMPIIIGQFIAVIIACGFCWLYWRFIEKAVFPSKQK